MWMAMPESLFDINRALALVMIEDGIVMVLRLVEACNGALASDPYVLSSTDVPKLPGLVVKTIALTVA